MCETRGSGVTKEAAKMATAVGDKAVVAEQKPAKAKHAR